MGGGRQNRRELTGFEECEQLRGKALVASEAFRLAGGHLQQRKAQPIVLTLGQYRGGNSNSHAEINLQQVCGPCQSPVWTGPLVKQTQKSTRN